MTEQIHIWHGFHDPETVLDGWERRWDEWVLLEMVGYDRVWFEEVAGYWAPQNEVIQVYCQMGRTWIP